MFILTQLAVSKKGQLFPPGIVPPHGSFGLDDLGPMATAVLRASACCIEIHKRLHMFETGTTGPCFFFLFSFSDMDMFCCFLFPNLGARNIEETYKTQRLSLVVQPALGVDDVRLCLHIGVGCGEISILQVGHGMALQQTVFSYKTNDFLRDLPFKKKVFFDPRWFETGHFPTQTTGAGRFLRLGAWCRQRLISPGLHRVGLTGSLVGTGVTKLIFLWHVSAVATKVPLFLPKMQD